MPYQSCMSLSLNIIDLLCKIIAIRALLISYAFGPICSKALSYQLSTTFWHIPITVWRGSEIFFLRVVLTMLLKSCWALIYSYSTPNVMSFMIVRVCNSSLMKISLLTKQIRNLQHSWGKLSLFVFLNFLINSSFEIKSPVKKSLYTISYTWPDSKFEICSRILFGLSTYSIFCYCTYWSIILQHVLLM